MALGELAEVGRVGARERVDRLGRVADDAELVAAAEPQVEERRLERRDVLELVDDEPLVLAADLGGDALVVGQHPGSQQQDVLHVHAGLGALDLLVAAEQPADGLGVDAVDGAAGAQRDLGVVVGADVADLGPLDLGRHVAQGRLVGPDALAGGGGGEHAELGLGQRGQLGAVDVRPEVAQLAQGRGVEGARLDALDPEAAQPAAHLAGRPGGEGDRQHLGGLVDARRDPVGDAVGDRPGLAGAGAGEHADRTAERFGDPALLGIEALEDGSGRVEHGNNSWGTMVDTLTSPAAGLTSLLAQSRRRRRHPSMSTTSDTTTRDVHHVLDPVVRLLPPAEEPAGPRGHRPTRSSTSSSTPRPPTSSSRSTTATRRCRPWSTPTAPPRRTPR